MSQVRRVLLVGGGSGGHITPNLAIATELKKLDPSINIIYIGSRKKLDKELVDKTKLPFYPIFTGKLRRYFSWQNFIDPFFVLVGILQSLIIIIKFKPDVIFSKGGFVSLPTILAGTILRKKMILHESDSRMGLANRISSKFVKTICISFPNLKGNKKKFVLTGNPIRKEILNGIKEDGYKITKFKKDKPIFLIWGGSLGAQQINDLVINNFEKLKKDFQVIHITGKNKGTEIKDENYISFEYINIDILKNIYSIVDIVIGRAGANSLYELALIQKPNIIIPLKNADQQNNAKYFEESGAGIILKNTDNFSQIINEMWKNEGKRDKMKTALAKIAKPNATEEIANIILNHVDIK